MAKLKIDVERDGDTVRLRVRARDRELHGHRATLSLVQHVVVNDSRAVNGERELRQVSFVVTEEFVHEIPAHSFEVFTYSGEQIDVEVHAKVVVDDGILWDTTLSREVVHRLGRKPDVGGDANELANPRDKFSLGANLAALPLVRKVTALAVLAFGVTFVAVNSIVGCHDQVDPAEAYVYGDGAPPLVLSLLGCGVVGATTWFVLRWLLRGYASFSLLELPSTIERATTIPIGQLVTGRTRADLWGPRVRVVAWNVERGQYRRGSGTEVRTVSFAEPVRGVVLYDERVEVMRRGETFAQHFAGDVSFERMFHVLYPPSLATPSHGVDVQWEVQLLHDQLVDFELPCDAGRFRVRDFYGTPAEVGG